MTDRIPLDAMTSDALDALYEQLEAAEETETQRQLATAREAFASATSRAARAEAALARIQALADEYPAGIDTALIHEALDGTPAPAATPAAEPGHDAGPSSTEAAANDRRWWNGEKTGEQ